MVQWTWEGGPACPTIGGRIVDLQFGLAIESANDIESAFHSCHRHLRTLRWHGRAGHPSSGALTEGGRAQCKAEEHSHECRVSSHRSESRHVVTCLSS